MGTNNLNAKKYNNNNNKEKDFKEYNKAEVVLKVTLINRFYYVIVGIFNVYYINEAYILKNS